MENEIREFFRQTAPKPADPTSFTLELNARLAAVEQIKAYRDREIRRTRQTLLAVFVAGLLMGGAIIALLILHPVRLPAAGSLASTMAQISGSPLLYAIAIPFALAAILLPLLISRRYQSPCSSRF